MFARDQTVLDGQTVSILSGATESYWHSLLDSVARLFLIPTDHWSTIDRILFPATGIKLEELIRLLPIPDTVERRAVFPHETLAIKNLIYPSSVHVMFDYHPSLLRSHFAAMVRRARGSRETKSPSMIFIDRRGASLRPLLNEDELIACLPDFVAVKLEQLSIVEQIELFAGADIIVAPHGAGLTNIVFAREGCVVVEIMMDRYCNWCYRRLAAIMKQSYMCVMGRATRADSPVQFTPWTVEKDRLFRAVDEARSR